MRAKIGVIGGGQLGRMAIEEARKYLADIEVLSPDYPSPAADLADAVHVGPIDDYESVMEFAEELDIVSYEIEGVSVEALFELERRGKAVLPPAGVLAEIKDKSRQKRLLDAAGVPTARWELLPDPASPTALEAAASRLGGFPIVQKARLGGYDGRGVAVLSSAGDAALKGPSLAEERIDFAKELAVVVAFAPDGSSAVYPCVEMAFDARANLCDSVLAPAREPGELRRRAEALALEAVRALGRAAGGPGAAGGAGAPAGVFAVEMFLAKDGRLLVNEIAPRPHNSGHYTIEACASSQFDQYVRLLLGLPLGSPELLSPAAMVNLVGEPASGGRAASGVPEYLGLEEALAVPGVAVHLYGKREVRPFRKMGHLTAVGATVEEALARAEAARALIRIVAR